MSVMWEMRRKDREITDPDEIIKIVDECRIVRIGMADGDFPYIVPVNFAYEYDGKNLFLYIHGALAGRRYEMLSVNPLCSFEMDVPLKMELLEEFGDVTMRYKCVMGKARATFLYGKERQSAIDNVIMARYEETRDFPYNKANVEHTAVVRLQVIEMSAKVNPLSAGPDI